MSAHYFLAVPTGAIPKLLRGRRGGVANTLYFVSNRTEYLVIRDHNVLKKIQKCEIRTVHVGEDKCAGIPAGT